MFSKNGEEKCSSLKKKKISFSLSAGFKKCQPLCWVWPGLSNKSYTFSSYSRAQCTTTAHKTTPIFRGWGRGEREKQKGPTDGCGGGGAWWWPRESLLFSALILHKGSSTLPLQKKQETLFFSTSYCCIIMGKCRHVLRRGRSFNIAHRMQKMK